MDIKFFSRGLDEREDKKLHDYFQKKVPSFRKLISHFAQDAVQLQVSTQRFKKNNAFNVEIILKIPKKTLVGKEASHSIEKAIDLAKDRVVKQLKKHEQQLRSYTQEKANAIHGLDRVHGALANYKQLEKKDDFHKAIRPLLSRLENFVRRELVDEGKNAVSGIVDEVIAEFYENFQANLNQKSVEQWLYAVATQKIKALNREKDQTVLSLEERINDLQESRLSRYFQDVDLESIEKGILEDEGVTLAIPEKSLHDRESHRFVTKKLLTIPALQRQAFTLHAIEGFSAEQIAKIQKRSKEDVKNDIEQVRNVLLDKLQEEFGEVI